MYLHFHISYESDPSPDRAVLRKQRNLLALRYAKYGAIVNAADPAGLKNPSAPADGMSMIVSREGGHNQPAPKGVEYYLPYQTSVVRSAGAEPTMIVATRETAAANDMDLLRFWRNRNRRRGSRPARFDWIRNGAALISEDRLPRVTLPPNQNQHVSRSILFGTSWHGPLPKSRGSLRDPTS